MKTAPKPVNEIERLAALLEYNLLDTMSEADYDDITNIAAEICNMPTSLISIIDKERQWFKSKVGMEPQETSRDVAFCAHAILNPEEMLIVKDPANDDRFHDNPLVTGAPHIGFYAGVPLVNNRGNALGTLCVMDNKPNDLTEEQKQTLKALARQIVTYFEMRKLNRQLTIQKTEMEQLNKDLSRFAHVVAHDIKSPCCSLAMSTAYLRDAYSDVLDAEGSSLLEMMETTSRTAIDMVDGILRHTKIVNQTDVEKERFVFGSLIDEVKKLLTIPENFTITIENEGLYLYTSHYILLQIILNLCTNAIKYNDKEHGELRISAVETDKRYAFTVADNGRGISAEDQSKIFELFGTLGVPDRYNTMGSGIGLSTVKRLVQKMHGKIEIESEATKGTTFSFTISK
jgi:signal transduction histidine kinase